MEWLLDWLQKVSLYIIGALGSFLAYLFFQQSKLGERVMVLEQAVKDLPIAIAELKKKIDEMRDEAKEGRAEAQDGREKIYEHIDAVRKELKDDWRDDRDRAAGPRRYPQ